MSKVDATPLPGETPEQRNERVFGVVVPPRDGTTAPEESAEQRDDRVTAENDKARLERQLALDETEFRNAQRVHLPREMVDEAARHGMEYVLEDAPEPEPAPVTVSDHLAAMAETRAKPKGE